MSGTEVRFEGGLAGDSATLEAAISLTLLLLFSFTCSPFLLFSSLSLRAPSCTLACTTTAL